MIGAVVGFFSRGWGWAKTHKSIAIPIATGLACGCAAWFLKPAPPQPKVEAHVADSASQAGKSASDTHKEEAPSRITTRKFARCPDAPGAPPAVVVERVVERGRVVTDTTKAEEHANSQEHKLDLVITPQATIPRLSGFWIPAVRPGFGLGSLGVDLRLTDRLSVMGEARPFAKDEQGRTRPELGVGLRVGFF